MAAAAENVPANIYLKGTPIDVSEDVSPDLGSERSHRERPAPAHEQTELLEPQIVRYRLCDATGALCTLVLQAVRSALQRFGTVAAIIVPPGKGFCFVEYETDAQAKVSALPVLFGSWTSQHRAGSYACPHREISLTYSREASTRPYKL
jgi:hypothetical protein